MNSTLRQRCLVSSSREAALEWLCMAPWALSALSRMDLLQGPEGRGAVESSRSKARRADPAQWCVQCLGAFLQQEAYRCSTGAEEEEVPRSSILDALACRSRLGAETRLGRSAHVQTHPILTGVFRGSCGGLVRLRLLLETQVCKAEGKGSGRQDPVLSCVGRHRCAGGRLNSSVLVPVPASSAPWFSPETLCSGVSHVQGLPASPHSLGSAGWGNKPRPLGN